MNGAFKRFVSRRARAMRVRTDNADRISADNGTRGTSIPASSERNDGDEREYEIRLVFALGNPGGEYAGNRRNVGFWAANRLAKLHHLEFATKTDLMLLRLNERFVSRLDSIVNESTLLIPEVSPGVTG